MKLSFLTSLFAKDKKSLTLPDSILIKKLKELSEEHEFSIFNNVTIFHHTLKYNFPLIILDESRGLYIFEKKEWTYDELKHVTVAKAQHQETSKDTLSFQKKQEIINKKFNELTHHSEVPIYNYLLMENLNATEYTHLHHSFKEFIPAHKVIFHDSTKMEIMQKLHNSPVSLHPLASKDDILGNLLIQYTLLDEAQNVKFCTEEQINIINHDIYGHESLRGAVRSGKTNTLLLKAIMQILTHKSSQVLIIKPTVIACDILKKKLVNIIEHAIIDFDILNILIVTPKEFLEIKKSDIPPLVLCDDANYLEHYFIHKLIEIQKDANLLLVNYKIDIYTHILKKEFFLSNKSVTFHHANKQAKALRLIAKLLKVSKASDIFIISHAFTRTKLIADLEYFIEEDTSLLDITKHLMIQSTDSLIFLEAVNIDELNPKHLIILDVTDKNIENIKQSITKAIISVDIVYEDNSEILTQLKEKYESNKE